LSFHILSFEKIELFRCRFLMHNGIMIYGYARVSTAAQDESGQLKQLKAAGCGRIFREKITGTTADRPQLGKLMKKLAPGDVVITPAVDRLSRDTTDLLVIAREMQRAGAGIRSLAEPNLDTTSRPHQRIVGLTRRRPFTPGLPRLTPARRAAPLPLSGRGCRSPR
jgi:hypothetical protein